MKNSKLIIASILVSMSLATASVDAGPKVQKPPQVADAATFSFSA